MMENESKLKFILYSGHDVSRKFFLFSNLNYHCLYKRIWIYYSTYIAYGLHIAFRQECDATCLCILLLNQLYRIQRIRPPAQIVKKR
jgi:hypothetical protein